MKRPLIDFKWKIKFNLHKFYFEKGMSLLNYFKYIILLIGLDKVLNNNLKVSLMLMFGYGVFCYLIGFIYVITDFYRAEIEVSNMFNNFVIDVRNRLKLKHR